MWIISVKTQTVIHFTDYQQIQTESVFITRSINCQSLNELINKLKQINRVELMNKLLCEKDQQNTFPMSTHSWTALD